MSKWETTGEAFSAFTGSGRVGRRNVERRQKDNTEKAHGVHMLCYRINKEESLPGVEERTTLGSRGRSGQGSSWDREDSPRKAPAPQTHHMLCPTFPYILEAELMDSLACWY